MLTTDAGTYVQSVFADATKIAGQMGRMDVETITMIASMILAVNKSNV